MSTGPRARSFGAVAAAYERFRLGYPAAVLEQIEAYAGSRPATALEIGAGTGKLTRLLAGAGIAVTATDPDPAMLAVLREQVPGVATVAAAFEDVPVRPAYDLVVAAAALHWTRPEGRWDRVAGLLRPGGVFANVGGPPRLADEDLEATVDDVCRGHVSDDALTPRPPAGDLRWPATELLASGRFADVREVALARGYEQSAEAYVGHLSTISAFLQLPEPERAVLLDRVRAVLPATVEVRADLTLHLARRV